MAENNVQVKQSWADESAESDNEDNNKEIGQDLNQETPEVTEPKVEVPKKDYGPVIARDRNIYGDFVVTTINIPDLVVPELIEEKGSDDSEESEESEPEEETKVEEPVKKGKSTCSLKICCSQKL